MSTIPHLQIETSSGVPIYRQIMDQVRNYISAGVLKAGDRLPSIRELARRLHINPTTITKAYGELDHAGVIELRHGKGAFISISAARKPRARADAELRRHAANLAAAARQMEVPLEEVQGILREEMDRLGGTPESAGQEGPIE